MRQFHVSRQAKKDLDTLGATIRLAAEMPGGGSDRSALAAGLRSYPCDNYLVFFRRTPRGTEIVRVVHGARRLERIFRRARRGRPDET